MFFVGLDLDTATQIELRIAFLRLYLLPVKFRTGFYVNPDTDLIHYSGYILTSFANCCRHILVININNGFCITDHLDVNKTFSITPDFALDFFLHEFPTRPIIILLSGGASGKGTGVRTLTTDATGTPIF